MASSIRNPEINVQVQDDRDLLELFLADQQLQDEIFFTTNYYRLYAGSLVPRIREFGLRDYRRRRDSQLTSFGATDLLQPMVVFRADQLSCMNNWLAKWWKLSDRVNRWIERIPREERVDCHAFQRLCHGFAAKFQLSSSALPLSSFSASLAGNPEDVFMVDGNFFTMTSLRYYSRYAQAGCHVSWPAVSCLAELGCGGGGQAEILARLHPDMTLLLFDIPPQIYIAEQFLKATFGDRVVSYRELRSIGDSWRPRPGGIHILGAWQIDCLSNSGADVFWSAASLCSMEPNVVARHLSAISNSSIRDCFLIENFDGLSIAAHPGAFGVLAKTTWPDYERALWNFRPLAKSEVFRETGRVLDGFTFSHWRRTEGK